MYVIYFNCFLFLFPLDLANTGAGIQRKRTLAKSLRDSFRRLRSKRGSKRGKNDPAKDGTTSPQGGVRSVGYEAAPQTRLIGEQRVDEDILSMVRCIYFGETFLGDGKISFYFFNYFYGMVFFLSVQNTIRAIVRYHYFS